jgi:hypothetical protein
MLPKADGQRAWQRALHSAEASELLAFLSLSACAVRAAILAKASEYLYSRPHSSDDERKRIGLAKALDHRSARSRKRSALEIDDLRELSRINLRLHAAGAYQLCRRREVLIERRCALRAFR